MKGKRFLSIVIPMHNTENFIEKCLHSLEEQTIKDFEVIIVDDGSTDESYMKAKKYLDDSTLDYKILRQKNLGQSVARNSGIREAIGQYILFLDSDDFVDRNLVEKTREEVYGRDLDMLMFDYKRVKADGGVVPTTKQVFDFSKETISGIEAFYAYKNNELRIWTASVIYSREFIIKNNLQYLVGCYGAEDLNFLFKSLMTAEKVRCIEESLSYYYQRRDSLTNSGDIKKNITVVDAMENVCEFIKDKSIDFKLEEIIRTEFTPEHIMYQIFGCIDKHNINEIVSILKEPKVRKYLKRARYNTTRYSKNIVVWMKIACYFPNKFAVTYLKRKG